MRRNILGKQKRGARRLKTRGFTLIECLISFLLLAVAMLGGISFFHNSDTIESLAARKKIMLEEAGAFMESLKSAGHDALTGSEAAITVGGFPIARRVIITDIDDDLNGSADYRQVHVQFSWTEFQSATPQQVDLYTFIAP